MVEVEGEGMDLSPSPIFTFTIPRDHWDERVRAAPRTGNKNTQRCVYSRRIKEILYDAFLEANKFCQVDRRHFSDIRLPDSAYGKGKVRCRRLTSTGEQCDVTYDICLQDPPSADEDVTLTVTLVSGNPLASHPVEESSSNPTTTAYVRSNLTASQRNALKETVRGSNLSCLEMSQMLAQRAVEEGALVTKNLTRAPTFGAMRHLYREVDEEDMYERDDVLDLDTWNEKLKVSEKEAAEKAGTKRAGNYIPGYAHMIILRPFGCVLYTDRCLNLGAAILRSGKEVYLYVHLLEALEEHRTHLNLRGPLFSTLSAAHNTTRIKAQLANFYEEVQRRVLMNRKTMNEISSKTILLVCAFHTLKGFPLPPGRTREEWEQNTEYRKLLACLTICETLARVCSLLSLLAYIFSSTYYTPEVRTAVTDIVAVSGASAEMLREVEADAQAQAAEQREAGGGEEGGPEWWEEGFGSQAERLARYSTAPTAEDEELLWIGKTQKERSPLHRYLLKPIRQGERRAEERDAAEDAAGFGENPYFLPEMVNYLINHFIANAHLYTLIMKLPNRYATDWEGETEIEQRPVYNNRAESTFSSLKRLDTIRKPSNLTIQKGKPGPLRLSELARNLKKRVESGLQDLEQTKKTGVGPVYAIPTQKRPPRRQHEEEEEESGEEEEEPEQQQEEEEEDEEESGEEEEEHGELEQQQEEEEEEEEEEEHGEPEEPEEEEEEDGVPGEKDVPGGSWSAGVNETWGKGQKKKRVKFLDRSISQSLVPLPPPTKPMKRKKPTPQGSKRKKPSPPPSSPPSPPPSPSRSPPPDRPEGSEGWAQDDSMSDLALVHFLKESANELTSFVPKPTRARRVYLTVLQPARSRKQPQKEKFPGWEGRFPAPQKNKETLITPIPWGSTMTPGPRTHRFACKDSCSLDNIAVLLHREETRYPGKITSRLRKWKRYTVAESLTLMTKPSDKFWLGVDHLREEWASLRGKKLVGVKGSVSLWDSEIDSLISLTNGNCTLLISLSCDCGLATSPVCDRAIQGFCGRDMEGVHLSDQLQAQLNLNHPYHHTCAECRKPLQKVDLWVNSISPVIFPVILHGDTSRDCKVAWEQLPDSLKVDDKRYLLGGMTAVKNLNHYVLLLRPVEPTASRNQFWVYDALTAALIFRADQSLFNDPYDVYKPNLAFYFIEE